MSLLEMQTLEPCPWIRTQIFIDDFCRKCLKGTGIATCRKSRTLATFERKERKNTAGFVILDILTHTKQLRLPCVMQSDFFFPPSGDLDLINNQFEKKTMVEDASGNDTFDWAKYKEFWHNAWVKWWIPLCGLKSMWSRNAVSHILG